MAKRIELPKPWQELFELLPETGMGYQKIDIILKDGRIYKNLLVINCRYLISENDEDLNFVLTDIEQIILFIEPLKS